MRKVTKLYRFSGHSAEVYDPEDCSPRKFQSNQDVNTRLFFSIYSDVYRTKQTIDYNRLITDRSFSKMQSWKEIGDNLTDEIVSGCAG